MANKVLTRVWEHSQQRGAARCLIIALADVADARGIAYPGVEHLAAMINETPEYTDKLINKLVAAGELYKIAGRGRGYVTRFAILPGLSDADQAQLKGILQDPFSLDKKGHPSTPFREKRGTPVPLSARKGVLPSEKRGTFSDTNNPLSDAPERDETTISKNDNQHDPFVGVGDDRARAEKLLLETNIYPATVRQIMALDLDWPTVVTSVQNLVTAAWGASAIADRLRQHPPTKGHPYGCDRPRAADRPDPGRNGAGSPNGRADRGTAVRPRPGDPAYYKNAAPARPDRTADPE